MCPDHVELAFVDGLTLRDFVLAHEAKRTSSSADSAGLIQRYR